MKKQIIELKALNLQREIKNNIRNNKLNNEKKNDKDTNKEIGDDYKRLIAFKSKNCNFNIYFYC